MTTDRQREQLEDTLRARYGGPFQIHTYADEVTVSYPIWTPAGRVTVGRYRYASATAYRKLDGRKPVTSDDVDAINGDLLRGFRRGACDPRYTAQARDDYAAALEALASAGLDVTA